MIRPPPTSTLFPYTTLFRSRSHLTAASSAAADSSPRPCPERGHARGDVDEHGPVDHHQRRAERRRRPEDRKSTRLNSSHSSISYAVFCLKKKKKKLIEK